MCGAALCPLCEPACSQLVCSALPASVPSLQPATHSTRLRTSRYSDRADWTHRRARTERPSHGILDTRPCHPLPPLPLSTHSPANIEATAAVSGVVPLIHSFTLSYLPGRSEALCRPTPHRLKHQHAAVHRSQLILTAGTAHARAHCRHHLHSLSAALCPFSLLFPPPSSQYDGLRERHAVPVVARRCDG